MSDKLSVQSVGPAGAGDNTTRGLARMGFAAAGVLVLVLLYTAVPGYTALPPMVLFALAVLCFLPATWFVRWLRATRVQQPGTLPAWLLAAGAILRYLVNLVWAFAILYVVVTVVLWLTSLGGVK